MSLNSPTSMTLTEEEIASLRRVAGCMIPSSAEFGVPGADDPAIMADMAASVGRDGADVKAALALVREVVNSAAAGSSEPAHFLAELKRRDRARFAILESLVLRTYYRDDRVLHAIGMEARPPFPKGFEVEQGDWSLLEPVRARGAVYRDRGT